MWSDPKRSRDLLREKATLERALNGFLRMVSDLEDAEVLLELGEDEADPETLAEAAEAFESLAQSVRDAEIRQMLSEEHDESNAILEVNSGAGGTDASDAGAGVAAPPGALGHML